MAIIRFTDRPFFRNPWLDIERLRRDMDMMMHGLGTDEPGQYVGGEVYPALNISEDSDNVYVRAEVPGVAGVDLDISVEGETLILKGERRACSTDETLSYHRREIECGSFSRAITLPTRIQVDKVKAKSSNGLLIVTLPKAEEAKPKQISVKVD